MTYSDALWGLPDPDTHQDFYADIPLKRFGAWVIDLLVIFAICVLILPFTAFIGLFFFWALWLGVGLIYRIWCMSARSATLGMRLMSIEFRNARGERFDSGTACLHTLLYTLMMSTLILQAISVIAILVTSRRQGLHDLLLGTAAVNRSALLR
ncbi:RDD family protein [Qingshengfaniella alkalisoli]|uniref:RDD family protein n=1 Tax=Qingshengfaniella alkalisoli TaxID=2599296 RepID=A0A5B8IWW9_9RHOB|nr:RDD family protein [Qingshengfaniella alkalisoli]QDY69371.1 RDD family protein [Qingshengfaniella alkalisoli]